MTKTVLFADLSGACRLIDVPFNWQHGEPVPANALEQKFATAEEALQALAARGRAQNRIHVPAPEKKLRLKAVMEAAPELSTRDNYEI